MIPIPGFIISILTFPGVIVHEFAHYFFCRIFRVAVFNVCFFRVGNPAGFVVHEMPRKAWQHVLIGIGPMFVNSIVGMIIGLPAALHIADAGFTTPVDMLLMYFGISIAMHSFPSVGDASSIWKTLYNHDAYPGNKILLKVVSTPIVILIYAGAIGSVFWLDALYGYAAVHFGAKWLVHALA